MTLRNPQPFARHDLVRVAPADWDALPLTQTVPLIMFSATPVPALPSTMTSACLFIPAA